MQNARRKQEFEIQSNLLEIANASEKSIMLENANLFKKIEDVVSSQWLTSIIIKNIVVENAKDISFFVQFDSIFKKCVYLPLIKIIRIYFVEQIHSLIDVFVDALRLFYWRLEENDAIVNILNRYFLFHDQNDQWIHAYINFRFEMQFDVNAIILINLLNDQWIYSFVIVDVLSQLIVFFEKMQLLWFNLTQMIC
jgi:hypothetical protein